MMGILLLTCLLDEGIIDDVTDDDSDTATYDVEYSKDAEILSFIHFSSKDSVFVALADEEV